MSDGRESAALAASVTGEPPAPATWPMVQSGWRRPALCLWIAAVVAVTVFSLLPQTAPPGEYGFDKMLHAAGYFVLALLPHIGFERRKAALAAALAMIPLGCAIEVAQGFVPARMGDVWDAVANGSGALLGVALGARFRQITAAVIRFAR